MTHAPNALPLGIDIGGSGIKGAPVDLTVGSFTEERLRIDTPAGAKPEDVIDVVAHIANQFEPHTGQSPIGVTIPGVVTHGVVRSAANIDNTWINYDISTTLHERLGRPVTVLNDADAAGVAELAYGAAKNIAGTVLVATLGTGIGSAVLVDGRLVPNTEFGHLEIDGHDAETRAASSIRKRENLTWEEWAARLQRYFTHLENLIWPDLIVIGGGVSKRAEKFLPLLDLRTPTVPAALFNDAGIIGAAHEAVDATHPRHNPQYAG
ncbi:polyphosphate--glucose phosphotransferase [Dermatophilus congolensis]|uniref:Polyphosphate glucokinase n=1 Tax=Dermatophilus congolensis TaxID=1863 RepID=A0AA46BMS7_9MICO|nr:ROK family protein [Dermatophilus congolensis]MBO3142743.1 ROK family protein [Dermatophilus congolensis]MBO3151735.1 ROK family protein [Dermatophilus congolensis]MBO3161264.1 ROK family protein [Dermatophilus congolensis]MBO3163017.1 ROK family protein [Dermatophilus congolensis]MBO3176569.1 ROK family protein [Dermatophilus congolensis]